MRPERERRTGAVAIALAATLAAGIAGVLHGPRALLLAATLLPLYALPGTVAAWRRHGAPPHHRPDVLASSVAVGAVAVVFLSTLLATLLRPGPLVLLLAAAAASLAALALPARSPSRPVRWRQADTLTLALALAFVPLAVALPLSRIGAETPAGVAYAPYFDYDWLQHVGLIQAVAQGVPPENPFYAGETLHYYWLWHTVPATLVAAGVPAPAAMGLSATATALLFVAVLHALLRATVPTVLGRAAALALALVAYSYKGLFVLARPFLEGTLGDLLRVPSAGQSGLIEVSPLSHGYLRDFLYEPHALSALTLLLAVLHLVRGRGRTGTALALGVAAAFAFGLDAFIGSLGLLAAGILGLAAGPGLFRHLRPAGVAAAALLLAAGIYTVLDMFRPGGLAFVPYGRLLAFFPAWFILDCGPMAVLGTAGAAIGRRRLGSALPLLALAAAALLAALFLRAEGDCHNYLRKGQKILQVPLLVGAGCALAHLRRRRLPLLAITGLILLALPSFALDLRVHSDVSPGSAATFLDRRDVAACRVLRAVSRPDDRVLVLPHRDDYTLEPALAGRGVVVGDHHHAALFQIDPATARARLDEATAFFQDPDPSRKASWARALGARFVLVNTRAAAHFPAGGRALAAAPGLTSLHRDGPVVLYRVEADE